MTSHLDEIPRHDDGNVKLSFVSFFSPSGTNNTNFRFAETLEASLNRRLTMTDHVSNRDASKDAAEHSGEDAQVAAHFLHGTSIPARSDEASTLEWLSRVPARQTDLS